MKTRGELPLFHYPYIIWSMDNKLSIFDKLVSIFSSHGYRLYLVGGTVRDYLLNIPLSDMDAVTDANPEEMKKFLDADFTFSKFGTVKYVIEGVKFDITTMRKENSYADSRHPLEITFIKDLKEDVKRRDFTVNALYLDDKHQVIDYVDGQKDLSNHLLKIVGDVEKRINEDPLRIIRAFRFSIDYDLMMENSLKEYIKNHMDLLDKINKEKVKQDFKKMKCRDKNKILSFLKDFNAINLYDVLE